MKKFLLSLLIGFIGFISFGYCINYFNVSRATYSASQQFTFNTNDLVCVKATVTNRNISIIIDNIEYSIVGGTMSCFFGVNNMYFNYVNANLELYTYQNFINSVSCPTCPDCPVCDDPYTSLECQQEYNLIPINEVNQNYCVSNGLCPSNVVTGDDLSGVNWSSLYINDIQHVSAPLIDITIPEEFNWDYTGNDEVFELSVEGYNVDTDYIAGIINTQNTKPTQSDLNDIINRVLPLFIPGLVIILFIYFVFRFIKKIF